MLNSELSPEDLKVENTVLRKRASDGLHMAEIGLFLDSLFLTSNICQSQSELPLLLDSSKKKMAQVFTYEALSLKNTFACNKVVFCLFTFLLHYILFSVYIVLWQRKCTIRPTVCNRCLLLRVVSYHTLLGRIFCWFP